MRRSSPPLPPSLRRPHRAERRVQTSWGLGDACRPRRCRRPGRRCSRLTLGSVPNTAGGGATGGGGAASGGVFFFSEARDLAAGSGRLRLASFDPKAFKSVVYFLYAGTVPRGSLLDVDEVYAVLLCADLLLFPRLKSPF
mmetsp:Transcript_19024/g.43129  ORF Transcript_19024/g.43129 Transcript_19024/m.43129 type:complete len:140 (+) Transcript_19024:648-1067(+)